MKSMTIQQAIFLLSTLLEKERNLRGNLYNYRVPLAVNGQAVVDLKSADMMQKDLETLERLQTDIQVLKTGLAKANVETQVDQVSLNERLEQVRLKRSYLSSLSDLLANSHYSKVETGVGVVTYGVLNEDQLRQKIQVLEAQVFALSQEIDTINAHTVLELDLEDE